MNIKSSLIFLTATCLSLNATAILKTGQTTSYQDGDDGYYSSSLGLDRNHTDLGNGVILDNSTNLEWQKMSTEQVTMDWATSVSYCTSLDLDGTGWRLPTLKEIQSIIDSKQNNPSVNSIFTPMPTSSVIYWSITGLVTGASQAWYVNISDGSAKYGSKTSKFMTMCVRSDD